ncbi:unnamed protein product [Symbiodinium sp. CCMP2592]|nr:unnamed protein product [Symbiodinium sp. CCMP2592]
MISCCAVLCRSRGIRAKVRRWHRRGQQTVQWHEEDLRQEGWRPLGTYHDASDPEHGEATIYIKDDAVRICHSIYGPVPCSDGVILQHDEDVYDVQMGDMQGRIDAKGFHCSGYLNPTVAAAVSRQPMTSAPITEPKLQKACRNLAAILGPGAFKKEDYESIMNQGSASDALLSEIRAMGDDYGGWAAFEVASREHEESSEQQIWGKRLLRQLRRQFFVPGAGRFFPEAAYRSWRQQQNARRLPTVAELRTEGYMLKHFAKLETEAKDAADCIRGVLLTGPEQLVSYVLGNHAFWAKAENARRLDEVEEATELPKKPKSLLERLEQGRKKRLAAERAKRDKPFEHLQMIPPLPVPGEALEFRVLSSEEQVREAAERLKNCAATYIPDVVAQKCALVGLFQKENGDGDKASKIVAMGQLFAKVSVSDGSIVTSWGQRSQNSNKTLTSSQDQHFEWALENLSKLWTQAVQDELDEVLPRQASGERVMRKVADQVSSAFERLGLLGRQVVLRELAQVIDGEGYSPEWRSLAQGLVERALESPATGIIPDETIGSCLAIAGKVQDSNLLRSIMSSGMSERLFSAVRELRNFLEQASRKGGDLTINQWARLWLLDLPMDPSIVAEGMFRTLPEKAGERMKRIDQIVGRLLQAGAGSGVLGSVLDTALRLDIFLKLRVLLSDLPFLVDALTEPLLSAAQAGDHFLARSSSSKLLKAGVAHEQTKAIFKQALQLDNNAKLTVLLSDLPFHGPDLVEALRDPLLSAADAHSVKVVQSIVRRLVRANVETTWTTGILEEAGKLKLSAQLILLLFLDLPFVASPSVLEVLCRHLLFFAKQEKESAIVKLIGSKLSAFGIKPADADSILRSGSITGTRAQLRVLTSGLRFHSGTVTGLAPEMASSLVEAAERNDMELVQESEGVFHQCGIRAEHTSCFLERACHAGCYYFMVDSTLPFEPKALTLSLAQAYLQRLVEDTDCENDSYHSDIEPALDRAGANKVAFLASVLLCAADKLPPDAPVIRNLLDRLVKIGITTPVAEFLMEEIRPEHRMLLSRRIPFSKSFLGRAGINRH